MNLISAEKISKSYGIKSLFNNITFGVQQCDKIGIVAKNGSGKSTLLKILGKVEVQDSGIISYRNGLKIAFQSQDPQINPETTVNTLLTEIDTPEAKAFFKYEEVSVLSNDTAKLEAAIEDMHNTNAWNFAAEMDAFLDKLKIDFREKKWGHLSGGQQKRIMLAITLLSNPDVLLLDEPTNHLDLDMIEWLETYLESKNITLVMVTHDRYFLETICKTIWELDNGNLYIYPGNYSYYMEKKAEREQIEVVNLDKARNLYKKELEWMRKMPKARTTKAKSRTDSFYEIKDKASQKIKKDELDLNIKSERLGSKIVEYHKVEKRYGEKLILKDFTYNFKRMEKIGIVGPNGVGKTTLLKLTANELTPDKGKIVVGETVKIGYYKQEGLKLPDDLRVIEYIKNIAEIIPLEKGKKITASQMLERFMFPPEMHYQYISTLSGGERKRLYLLGTLMDNPNFLILDEPTNDLDIFTMNVLEDFLENFSGNVLAVSHDRYFMDKIVDHLFIMQGDGMVRELSGNYSDYRASDKLKCKPQVEMKSVKNVQPQVPKSPRKEKQKIKLSFNEKREFETLEKEIEFLEKTKATLTEKISNPDLGHEELVQIGKELEQIISSLDAKTERWLELSEIAE